MNILPYKVSTTRGQGQPTAIVSNNNTSAIQLFLAEHHLQGLVGQIVGRTFGQPDRMKPEPDSILTALELLQASATQTVLIGDSVTDVQAARTAKIKCIGYAKTEQRGEELRDAGATATVTTIIELADATQQ